MRPSSLFCFLFICAYSSCKQDAQTRLSGGLQGNLILNSCQKGSSHLVFKGKRYGIGSKSNERLGRVLSRSEGGQGLALPSREEGCIQSHTILFKGEFEKEKALTGHANDALQDVIQVYQFQMI